MDAEPAMNARTPLQLKALTAPSAPKKIWDRVSFQHLEGAMEGRQFSSARRKRRRHGQHFYRTLSKRLVYSERDVTILRGVVGGNGGRRTRNTPLARLQKRK